MMLKNILNYLVNLNLHKKTYSEKNFKNKKGVYMIKEKFEERTITKKVCVEKKMICDVCGKEIKGEYYE